MRADGINKLISIGVTEDIVATMCKCYELYKDQPIDLVKYVAASGYDIDGKCQSVFAYLVDNVRYQLDPGDNQFIRTPARLLEDGCGDCKSLTMFICCCLHCLGISHKMRFVSFDNSTIYSHVYAVALDERGEEIILDACETDPSGASIYDYARPYTHKRDIVYNEQ